MSVSASDKDEDPNLILSIHWSNSKFYKNRAIVSTKPEWQNTFTLDSITQTGTSINGIVKVGNSLDWESFDSVHLYLTVTDENTVTGFNDQDESKLYF